MVDPFAMHGSDSVKGWVGGVGHIFFNKVVLEQYFVERRWYAFKSSSCKQN